MSRAEELIALAERVEALDGPDRDADLAVAQAIYSKEEAAALGWAHFLHPMRNGLGQVLEFTASMDAAFLLMPKGHWWAMGREEKRPWARCFDVGQMLDQPEEYGRAIDATTPALALTAAALRARAAMEAADV